MACSKNAKSVIDEIESGEVVLIEYGLIEERLWYSLISWIFYAQSMPDLRPISQKLWKLLVGYKAGCIEKTHKNEKIGKSKKR